MAKPIALAADHGGFELKEAVKAHLEELGLEYIDFGTHSTDSVDYPDMAVPACDAVVSGQCEKALLFCGTGGHQHGSQQDQGHPRLLLFRQLQL